MKNETLERLRLPSAWVLIGAVGASMLAGLIGLIAQTSDGGTYRPEGSSFPAAVLSYGDHFFGLPVMIFLAVAVALVLTSERTRPSALPVVVTAIGMSGLGLLFVLINVITVFMIDSGSFAYGFANFVSTLGSGAVLGLIAFVLLKAFNDPNLVPRPAPQAGQFDQQGFPPVTGAQQSFAGYGQQAYGQDAYGQPAYGTGAQQAYGQDAYGQQAYDPSAYGQQQAYGTGGQQAYDPNAYGQQQAYGTGAQQAYDPNAYGQQYFGSGAQQAYGQDAYGQQAYDPNAYGQQQAYGTGGQQAYDPNAYGQAQYAGADQAQQPSTGEQAAQDAIQYGWYQGDQQYHQGQDTPSGAGVDPFFNSGEQGGNDASSQGGAGYGNAYGESGAYGSDQQGQGAPGHQQGWYGSDEQR